MSQLGQGLGLCPQRFRGHKALKIKRLFPREQGIHRPPQLLGEYGQRFGLTVLVFKCGNVRFSRLALPDKEDGGFGKGPASMDGANLLARGPEPFAVRLLGTCHQPALRHKGLHAGKAREVLNLRQNPQGENLPAARDRL
jgi:hypothetical protein